jgi:hypothetical protein
MTDAEAIEKLDACIAFFKWFNAQLDVVFEENK